MEWKSCLKSNHGIIGTQIRDYILQNDVCCEICSDYGNISERYLAQTRGQK